MHRCPLTSCWTLVALPLLSLLGATAGAAILTVNTLIDEDSNDMVCSLREAITAANNNADYHECTGTGYGNDTIVFSVSGPIPLTSTLPAITDTQGLTIDGTGQNITISGGGNVQLMQVAASATLNLQYLTLSKGASGVVGGAVYSDLGGTLTVANCTFSGNQGSSGSYSQIWCMA